MPALVDELLNRKKWKSVAKDPLKSLKDENLDKTQYWTHLNNLPPSRVDLLVSEQIIQKDRESCDRILSQIYQDSLTESDKKSIRALEREKAIGKLHRRHNTTVEMEKSVGVRLGSLDKEELAADGGTLNLKFD